MIGRQVRLPRISMFRKDFPHAANPGRFNPIGAERTDPVDRPASEP